VAIKKMTDEERAASIAEIEAHFQRKAELANAPAIRMQPGQTVSGVIQQVVARDSDHGVYPVITMEMINGTLGTFHAFHQIVQERLKELKPKKGDRLFIMYAGERKKNNPTEDEIKKGRDTYHLYTLETDASLLAAQSRVDTEYSWE
jgi:hypothetical protein